MYSRQHRTSKSNSDNSDAPASNQFAPRPFVVQPQVADTTTQQNQTDDLQAVVGKTKEVSDGFPEPGVFTRHVAPPKQPRVQMKLTIGKAGDKYEQEADQVAADVVQRINAPAEPPISNSHQSVQHQQVEQQDGELQKKSEFGIIQREEMPIVAAQGTERVSDGFPEPGVFTRHVTPPKQPRVQMKLTIGKAGDKYEQEADQVASQVVQQINAPGQADQLNQSIQAKAFTTKQELFFKGGDYQPGSRRNNSESSTEPVQKKQEATPNQTGLPDALKSGAEHLGGVSLDGVKVHYNSSQPAQLNALAYAQGSDIHIAPGQEQHLPHEAWHVVQQAQGRVKATKQLKSSVAINDDVSLEKEADVMGAKAMGVPHMDTELDQNIPEGRKLSQNEDLGWRNPLDNCCGVSLSAPTQLYTQADGKKMSANDNYYIKNRDDKKLFVKAGATLGSWGNQIVATGATEVFNGHTYSAYHYYANTAGGFVNDCLGLAENIARSTKVSSRRAEFRAPGAGGGAGKLFGHNDKQNTEIAQDANWYSDEAANPAIGQAYAIAPTVEPGETGLTEAPYHVAAVVAKDGTDNITLEADAGTRRNRPLFDIYDTTPPGTRADTNSKTFHEVYVEGFTYTRETTPNPPSTGVLVARTD